LVDQVDVILELPADLIVMGTRDVDIDVILEDCEVGVLIRRRSVGGVGLV
jgi:hypothetical protein